MWHWVRWKLTIVKSSYCERSRGAGTTKLLKYWNFPWVRSAADYFAARLALRDRLAPLITDSVALSKEM